MRYYAKFDAAGNRETSVVEGVHFTTADELKKYTDDGFVEINIEDQELYASNEYIRNIKTGKPILRPPYVPTIVELAASTWITVKAARNDAEQAGCPYMDKTLDSDQLSVQRISIAVQAAQGALAAGMEEFVIDWTMQDNNIIKMTAVQVIGMSAALAAYSNSLHERARQIREQIDQIVADYDAGAITEAKTRTMLKNIKFAV